VAMGNRTYLGWSSVFDQAFAQLAEAGVLHQRQPAASAALTEARAEVEALFTSWDDAQAQRIAASNLFLDRSLAKRRQEFLEVAAAAGQCARSEGYTRLPNALRGQWTMNCENGPVLFDITLAPIQPPLIQHLELRRLDAGSIPSAETCP